MNGGSLIFFALIALILTFGGIKKVWTFIWVMFTLVVVGSVLYYGGMLLLVWFLSR
jgi:hypothetical protein